MLFDFDNYKEEIKEYNYVLKVIRRIERKALEIQRKDKSDPEISKVNDYLFNELE
jgi:hypothetical protein